MKLLVIKLKMKLSIHSLLKETLLSGITDYGVQTIVSIAIVIFGIIFIAMLFNFIFRDILSGIVNKAFLKTRSIILISIAEARVINLVALFMFAVVLDIGSTYIGYKGDDKITLTFANWLVNVSYLSYYVVATWTLTRIISAVNIYYERKFDQSNQYPIYGYTKVVQFVIWCMAILLYISFLMEKSPLKMLTGIGAVSAFVLLIFKDTFLGLVSSILATANQIVKVGDWVNVPKHNIDGEVIFISITVVKIKNWDNTVTSIPTFALTSDAIHNWQSMVKSGARRIFRAIYLDVNSIHRCNVDLQEFLASKYDFIKKYFADSENDHNIGNLALFRLYMNDYLSKNELLVHHPDLPTLVRYLAPTPTGLPVQIYAFSKEVYLKEFEETQSAIFEHVFMVLNDFELDIFQANSVGVTNN